MVNNLINIKFSLLLFLPICLNSYANAQWELTNNTDDSNITCITTFNNVLFLGTYDQGVFASRDGLHWSQRNNGLNYFSAVVSNINDFATFENRLIAGTKYGVFYSDNFLSKINMIDSLVLAISLSNGYLIRSNDKGLTWFTDSTFSPAGITGIDIIDDRDIYLGTDDGKIFSSNDYAATWTDITGNYIGEMIGVSKFGNYLYVATQSSGVWRRKISGNIENDTNPFLIYPNPFVDNFTVENPDLLNGFTISVYDIKGQLVASQVITGLKTVIDLTSFAGGIYIIKLNGNDKVFVEKIVKE